MIEIFGALTGVLYIALEIRQNRYMWIVGGLSALVYIIVFYNSALYASMGLQFYYAAASLYGWIKWSRESREEGGKESEVVVKLTASKALLSSLITLAGVLLLWYILDNFTQDPMPLIDALIAALSMLATYWVANKYIQHWLLWIVANVLAIYIYLSQALYLTAALYSVYAIAALVGLWHWRKFPKVL